MGYEIFIKNIAQYDDKQDLVFMFASPKGIQISKRSGSSAG